MKSLPWTFLLWSSSLLAGTAALFLAEIGTPPWVLAPLLTWLATLGLPTLLAVLLLAAVWPGPSLPAFLVCAAILAFCFQVAAVRAAGAGVSRSRRGTGR